jgi:hypothetical protein
LIHCFICVQRAIQRALFKVRELQAWETAAAPQLNPQSAAALTNALKQLNTLWFGLEYWTNTAWGAGGASSGTAIVGVLDELLSDNVSRLTALAEAAKVETPRRYFNGARAAFGANQAADAAIVPVAPNAKLAGLFAACEVILQRMQSEVSGFVTFFFFFFFFLS